MIYSSLHDAIRDISLTPVSIFAHTEKRHERVLALCYKPPALLKNKTRNDVKTLIDMNRAMLSLK